MTEYQLHLQLVKEVSSTDEGLEFLAEHEEDEAQIYQIRKQVRFSFIDSVFITFVCGCGVLKIAETLITYWR